MSKGYEDLIAWQKAIVLVENIYKATSQFPKEEVYTLVSQIKKAAVSIPSNIAEGHARSSRKEFGYFLSVAIGSTAEVKTQLIIAKKLNFIDDNSYNSVLSLVVEVEKILKALLKSTKL